MCFHFCVPCIFLYVFALDELVCLWLPSGVINDDDYPKSPLRIGLMPNSGHYPQRGRNVQVDNFALFDQYRRLTLKTIRDRPTVYTADHEQKQCWL